jgi:hypothetical protein
MFVELPRADVDIEYGTRGLRVRFDPDHGCLTSGMLAWGRSLHFVAEQFADELLDQLIGFHVLVVPWFMQPG